MSDKKNGILKDRKIVRTQFFIYIDHESLIGKAL